MGKELYCDFCRATIPTEAGIQKIQVGMKECGEACITCASQLSNGLNMQRTSMATQYRQAFQARPAITPPVISGAPAPAPQVPSGGGSSG